MIQFPFYQNEWLGIKFTKLKCNLTLFRVAGELFYDSFYEVLFIKYKDMDELPSLWRKQKLETYKKLSLMMKKNSKVLSLGSGLGFIEDKIFNLRPDIFLECYDFSKLGGKFLYKKNPSLKYHSILPQKRYDVVFCVQFTYAFDNKNFIDFFSQIKQCLNKDSILISVDHSFNDVENDYKKPSTKLSFFDKIKIIIRPIYYLLFKKNKIQFWGWIRDNERLEFLFKKVGLEQIESFPYNGESFKVYKISNLI